MIIYYTDGSCEPNPGVGGFVAVRDMVPAVWGGEHYTTNIRMEGLGIMAALVDADGRPCKIFTDSQFWIDVILVWSLDWERRGWVRRKNKPIVNLDIVKEVCGLYRRSASELIWVRGHNNDPGNCLADSWAAKARFKTNGAPWCDFIGVTVGCE